MFRYFKPFTLVCALLSLTFFNCSKDEASSNTGSDEDTGSDTDVGSDADADADISGPVCGNDELEEGEECDDGNSESDDGCSPTCTFEAISVCGNGELEEGEECDDGNSELSDGCSPTCAQETGWICSGSPSECEPICGDQICLVVEDDDVLPEWNCVEDCIFCGNDICSENETPESCFLDCPTTCGDGYVVPEAGEECDDSGTQRNDGCSPACIVEDNWECFGSPSECEPICGDGVLLTEECDDGGNSSDDGCSWLCEVEFGWICSGSPSECEPICGDGVLLTEEECDDGGNSSSDGCSWLCEVESGWTCSGSPSECEPICGDGLFVSGEICDDQNLVNSDGCSASCDIESGWNCTGVPSNCTTTCGDSICVGEENAERCVNDCPAVCGDNVCTHSENSDTCLQDCPTLCGDSICDFDEDARCDDCPPINGDGYCTHSENASSTPNDCYPICNDSWCTHDENPIGCSEDCPNVCGDGFLVLPETCDDQNNTNVDGCDESCSVEEGWVCSGSPSMCVTICGDLLCIGDEDVFNCEQDCAVRYPYIAIVSETSNDDDINETPIPGPDIDAIELISGETSYFAEQILRHEHGHFDENDNDDVNVIIGANDAIPDGGGDCNLAAASDGGQFWSMGGMDGFAIVTFSQNIQDGDTIRIWELSEMICTNFNTFEMDQYGVFVGNNEVDFHDNFTISDIMNGENWSYQGSSSASGGINEFTFSAP